MTDIEVLRIQAAVCERTAAQCRHMADAYEVIALLEALKDARYEMLKADPHSTMILLQMADARVQEVLAKLQEP